MHYFVQAYHIKFQYNTFNFVLVTSQIVERIKLKLLL